MGLKTWLGLEPGGDDRAPLGSYPADEVVATCPETVIVFVTHGRPELAARSYASLSAALAPYRDRVRVILSDASDDLDKMAWARQTDADDVILTPRFTPAATSRNLAMTLALDKYVPRYVCHLEDDFAYHPAWYPSLVATAARLHGARSPLGLAYGVFSASAHAIPEARLTPDPDNGVTAYIFGAVATQRFMPLSHYLAVFRQWDADVLGISFAQTGGQTFRNTMRGFCGAILPGELATPIAPEDSTWRQGRRDPGPPAHSFNLREYEIIRAAMAQQGSYPRDRSE